MPVTITTHQQQSASKDHVVTVRGAPTLVLTIRRLKAAVSPLEIHSINRPNLIFLPVGNENHNRTITEPSYFAPVARSRMRSGAVSIMS